MLLPREQNPWNCGYVLGAYALKALADCPADILELQQKMSHISKKTISPTQVITAACWLYLIDAIRLDEFGRIEKCD